MENYSSGLFKNNKLAFLEAKYIKKKKEVWLKTFAQYNVMFFTPQFL